MYIITKDKEKMSVDWETFELYGEAYFSVYIEETNGTILDLKKFPVNHSKKELQDYYQKTINANLTDLNYYGVGVSFVTPSKEYIRCSFITFASIR